MTRPRNPFSPKKAPDGTGPAAPSQFPAKSRAPESPASPPTQPGARISRRAADRLRSGHVWVYASDIEQLVVPPDGDPPALLPVADPRGILLGTALYSPSSQIALRLVSREQLDEPAWLVQLESRLRAAIARRLPALSAETDSCRLAFSEADQLPGLIVDKYGPLVILQLLARSLDSKAVRDTCIRVLREALEPAAILERPDPRIRELEGLSAPELAPLWARDKRSPTTNTEFHLNGLSFHYDANAGQKTGAFLDQRENYLAAAAWAARLASTGRALDVCTYQGGFALHLALIGARVTGIDAERDPATRPLLPAGGRRGANKSRAAR